jgi:hypothetical protein
MPWATRRCRFSILDLNLQVRQTMRDRQFWKLCITEIMLRPKLVQACLRQLSNDERVDGGIEVREQLKLNQ